ncbi:MAG: outer membrane lipoprotein carrier protein LolA [Bacilli bacterium]|nr:outer membrane lipoprotein carrier protein LolA [Bacilli bacterium]
MDSKAAINKFKKNIESKETYTLTGQMDIISNEELYQYNVVVDHKKEDNYKASLKNKESGHEQIILKNKNGVYIVTPSLNKSFKFQSDWPFNSSQAYILESLLKDFENDSNILFEEKDEKYYLTSTVNYPNNTSLVSQKVTFNKEMIPELVEVFDKNGNESITFKISKIEFGSDLDESYFEVEESANEECCETTGKINEIVYPMYLPIGTKFKSEETVKTKDSERVILTFTGDKSFILIEEASKSPENFEVTTTSGELVFYENVLGNLNNQSLNWTMNGKDYYIIGNNLSNEEMLKVAASTSAVSLTK